MTSYTQIELSFAFRAAPGMSDRINEFSAAAGWEITREGEVLTLCKRDSDGACLALWDVPWSAVKFARRDHTTAATKAPKAAGKT